MLTNHFTCKTKKAAIEVIKSSPVSWVKNSQWTDKLVAYLCKYPDFCQKLFSDSTGAAKQEGCMKMTAKDREAQQYGVLAYAMFHNEPTQLATFDIKPAKFATTVEMCLCWLVPFALLFSNSA
jgi:hypothetical protein